MTTRVGPPTHYHVYDIELDLRARGFCVFGGT